MGKCELWFYFFLSIEIVRFSRLLLNFFRIKGIRLMYKISFFVPLDYAEIVKLAVFKEGAG
ncbi:MAG: hypothetical protein ACJAS1_004229, partial [Oleiphilaceae bacterium]